MQILARARTRSALRAYEGDLGSGVGEGEGRAAGSAAVADDEHAGFREADEFGKRRSDAGGVGIGSAPLAAFAPDGVDGADAAGQGIDEIQITDDFLFVRNGDAEAGERQAFGEGEEVAELRGRDEER